ncbi:hypothetical protein [Streptomyces sp. NPDC021356]|uniref:hypothetical protein n=1 Tax=Streptomyces sp. NPDC021356 TaxID=3154900 RepID=UPI0033FFE0FB
MENHDETAQLRAELEKLIRWHGEDYAALTKMRTEVTRLRGELAAALERKAADRCADRVVALREAAEVAESLRQFEPAFGPRKSAQVSENVGILRVADELRRMADDAQPAEHRPPSHRWAAEFRDPVADEWIPGTRFLNRNHAVERYQAAAQKAPAWKDGTPVERRLVRETTTYTVEAEHQLAAGARQDETAATETRPEACPPGCVACATDESHDPAPAAGARQDGAQR